MTETVEPARNLVDWLVDVIRTMGQRLKASFDRLPKKEKQIWGRYLQKMRTVYAQAVRLQQRLDVALLEVQAEEMAEKQDRKQKRAAKPKNDPELDAEARRKKLREDLQARQDKPLIGTQGDIGQMDMLGGNDLFSAPAAAKAESGERRAEGQSLANARKRGEQRAELDRRRGGSRNGRQAAKPRSECPLSRGAVRVGDGGHGHGKQWRGGGGHASMAA